jgi:hypothetical protein
MLSSLWSPSSRDSQAVACLVSHVAARLTSGSLFTAIHLGSSDYLRFLHDLTTQVLIDGRPFDVLDYSRVVKLVYIQQAVRRNTPAHRNPYGV